MAGNGANTILTDQWSTAPGKKVTHALAATPATQIVISPKHLIYINFKILTFKIQKQMATIALKGNPIQTNGELPVKGEKAKDFTLAKNDLSRVSMNDFTGNKLILNIFPSLDTGICAASVRQFNKIAGEIENTKVLCISRDLPFAQSRFCGAEGLNNIITLSDYADGSFGKNYGLEIVNGPMAGLHSRVVIIVDENGLIKYTQQVPEITTEPNYDDVLKHL